MKERDDKVKSISVKIDTFSGGSETLEDVLIYSNYALSAFYSGALGIEETRGEKERIIRVKTILNKAVAMIKAFPYVEN